MSYENHDPQHELIWRPFQLAFNMTLASSSERSHEERKIFDLIWFQRVGKTEHTFFCQHILNFFRRLDLKIEVQDFQLLCIHSKALTIQQFQRAAALITACEL